jgi:hypothetical protein
MVVRVARRPERGPQRVDAFVTVTPRIRLDAGPPEADRPGWEAGPARRFEQVWAKRSAGPATPPSWRRRPGGRSGGRAAEDDEREDSKPPGAGGADRRTGSLGHRHLWTRHFAGSAAARIQTSLSISPASSKLHAWDAVECRTADSDTSPDRQPVVHDRDIVLPPRSARRAAAGHARSGPPGVPTRPIRQHPCVAAAARSGIG